MSRAVWVAVVALATGVPAAAQPLEPVGAPPPAGTLDFNPASPARPPAVLGAPVGIEDRAPARPAVTPVESTERPRDPRPARAAGFGAPTAEGAGGPAEPVPTRVVDTAVARTAYNPPPVDPVNEFLARRSDMQGEKAGGEKRPETSRFGDSMDKVVGDRSGERFRSDHLFDGFISPLSNPFLAEDPRSLTEGRPIFIYQNVPNGQKDFRGGHISFFGAQARVAITDRWSLVFHKIGGVAVKPGSGSVFSSETGVAELWLGPKYTFYRGEENGAIAAGGLQFQFPIGPSGAFQDTGALSLVPYVTYGQNFLRDFSAGSFNSILSTGYSFSTNNQRSDYYWLSAHLDFDVANMHRFYPLMELNWLLYTTDGKARPMGSEGRDLINFGAAAGSGLLTVNLGGRVKISEHAQFGTGFEFPLAGRKDFFQNRFTLDFILRY